MVEYPAWKDMSPGQKFEFLNEWCSNLSRQVQTLESENQDLRNTVRRLQSAALSNSTDAFHEGDDEP